jgi:hypothetical protein
VRDGDGAVLRQQQLRHRLAHDVGAADDHGVDAIQLAQHRLGQHDAADRRAGNERLLAGGEAAHVDHMEAVHVLVRADGVQTLALSMCLGTGICTRIPCTADHH